MLEASIMDRLYVISYVLCAVPCGCPWHPDHDYHCGGVGVVVE